MSSNTNTLALPGSAGAWLMAIRPATLTAALSPVIVGNAAAIAEGDFAPSLFLLPLLVSLLIQMGTNLANDLFDFEKGVDTAARLGPPRVTQKGLLSLYQVRAGMVACFALAAIGGLYLITVGGWPILAIGLVSIACGLAYTGGPWPLGYHGLGDVAAFACFGLAGVTGSYYLQTEAVSWQAVVAGSIVGSLIAAILVVNNLRDREGDAASGKRTLAVLVGDRWTRVEYFLLLAGAYAMTAVLALGASPAVLLPFLTAPLAVRVGLPICRGATGRTLNATLKQTSQLNLAFSLALAAGLIV